jgi:phage gpG-like protein
MRLDIEILGDTPISRDLGRVKNNIENWEPVWPDVAKHLARGAKRQFDSHGVYGSGGWDELAPSTLKRKQALGQPSDILRATGRLEDSLTIDDHEEHLQIENRDAMWWGTLVPYAKYHQQGKGVPQRRPVEPPEGSRRYIVRILQAYALSNDRNASI